MITYKVSWKAGWMDGEQSEDYDCESSAYEAFLTLKEDFRDEEDFYCMVEYTHRYVAHFFESGEDDDE